MTRRGRGAGEQLTGVGFLQLGVGKTWPTRWESRQGFGRELSRTGEKPNQKSTVHNNTNWFKTLFFH